MGLCCLFPQLVWSVSGPMESAGILRKGHLLAGEGGLVSVVCTSVVEVC